ncbi:MAG TPA: DUF1259 domain-containing protein [Blastocatellia bacterium]|nr:DUF1259 domain-containing protein [Blastocatellia bacterium]
MKKTEPTNVIATIKRVVKRGMAGPAVIGALVLLVPLSAILAGGAISRAKQQAHGTAQSGTVDWKAVERAMGRPRAIQPGDVYRFSMPRSDLRVTVGNVEVKPALALGSWAAFKMVGKQAMVTGDLVMTEDEVSPVMARLQQGGVQQTALHNHILHESPRVMYMHIGGRGDPVKLAEAISAALNLTKTPPPSAPGGGQPQALGIDTKQIEQTLGHSGKVNGGVFQVSVPRTEKITEAGMEVPPSMGVAIAMNFQPTGAGRAAITGDFVLIASEVNPVIRALRANGIEVTALHNHMLNDEPRLFFMHFWANDDAVKLARGLRAALDKTNSAKAPAA